MDSVLGIAVVVATFAGPIAAVLVTRYIDKIRDLKHRRFDIFRMLMRTRRALLSPEQVTALNMVEIEFHDVATVIEAFRTLHHHLNDYGAPNWFETRQKLQTRLLTTMARSLGYNFEQLDVLEGGYTPQGWVSAEQEQQQVRKLLIEVLSGQRALPVSTAPILPVPYPPPLPPPPEIH